MSRSLVLTALSSLMLAGCDQARAIIPDTSNPFHCGVALSFYWGLADVKGLPGKDMLRKRMTWEGRKAAEFPAARRSRSEAEALGKRLSGNADEAYETVKGCMQREDADPKFKAWYSGAAS